MKTLAVLLLSAAILLSAAACSGNDDVTTSPESKPISTDTSAVTDAETEAETDAVTEEEKDLSLGNVNGNTYKNDFIGIGCTLGDGWVFYNQEQIAQLNGIAHSYFDEDYLEQVKNSTIFYDMYALNESTSAKINLCLEKCTDLTVLLTDMDEVFTDIVGEMESLFVNSGGTNFKYELRDVKIGGETFRGMDIYVEINDVPTYETMFCIKSNEYLAYACVFSYIENTTDDILGEFFIID